MGVWVHGQMYKSINAESHAVTDLPFYLLHGQIAVVHWWAFTVHSRLSCVHLMCRKETLAMYACMTLQIQHRTRPRQLEERQMTSSTSQLYDRAKPIQRSFCVLSIRCLFDSLAQLNEACMNCKLEQNRFMNMLAVYASMQWHACMQSSDLATYSALENQNSCCIDTKIKKKIKNIC